MGTQNVELNDGRQPSWLCFFLFLYFLHFQTTTYKHRHGELHLLCSVSNPAGSYSCFFPILLQLYSFQSIVCDEEYAAEQKKNITNRFHFFYQDWLSTMLSEVGWMIGLC
jgi:hypothetical protein